jgi:hypothetical protein
MCRNFLYIADNVRILALIYNICRKCLKNAMVFEYVLLHLTPFVFTEEVGAVVTLVFGR